MPRSIPLTLEEIQRTIHTLRGQRVIRDADLARLYGVGTRELNRAGARNPDRFPADFATRLTRTETRNLMFQIGTSSGRSKHGGIRKPSLVFTEQGVSMLASVLHSPRAVLVSVAIIRTFVQLRQLLATHRELADRLAELERKLEGHDSAITDLFETLRQLLASPEPTHGRKIGPHQGSP